MISYGPLSQISCQLTSPSSSYNIRLSNITTGHGELLVCSRQHSFDGLESTGEHTR